MSAELALSVLGFLVSLVTLGIVLTLLGRKQLDYASRRDLQKLNDHLTTELGRWQYSFSQLYRYVEAVDDHTGAKGYLVFRKGMHRDDTSAREG